MNKKEIQADLSKYFKQVFECSNPSCKLLFGSDKIKGNTYCPKCSWKLIGLNYRFVEEE